MTLTPQAVALVRSTFRLLEPKSNVAALAFYQRMLAASPALRACLADNIEAESQRFMDVLRMAADLADRPELLRARLGRARLLPASFGLEGAGPVDEALLWSMGATLGSDFTPEARAAWATLVGPMMGSRSS